jgi:MFS family permease
MTEQKTRKIYYGYVIVLSSLLIQGVGIGSFVAYGVFFNSLALEFGWSRTTISGASSMAFLLMGFLGILAGHLNDRFGPRAIMTVTGIFLGCGYLLLSRLETASQLYLYYGLVAGIGLSGVDVIPLTTTARWFLRRRGTMTGLVKAGTGAGQLVIPLIAGLCITRLGWRSACVVIGLITMVFVIGAGRLLRRDRGETPGESNADRHSETGLSLQEALRNGPFWMLCTLNLLAASCMLIVMVHIVPHAIDMGMDTIKAAGVLSTIGGVSVLGRLSTGGAIDRIGTKKALIICLSILILSFLWLNISNKPWMMYLFGGIYGIAHGGTFTVLSPIVADLFGIRSHGALFGIVAFTGTVGGAVGPVLAGLIFDFTGSYNIIFMFMVLIASTSLLLAFPLRRTVAGKTLTPPP